MSPMRVLFVGNFWLGSDARSLKDCIAARADVLLEEFDLDHYTVRGDSTFVRAARRLMASHLSNRLNKEIYDKAINFQADVIFVYKGNGIYPHTLERIKKEGIYTCCYFPDPSPKMYGDMLAKCMGLYDLVFSAKIFHPSLWNECYKYNNKCEHVSHGYDPYLHTRVSLDESPRFDVALIANWRGEYESIMSAVFSDPACREMTFLIGGTGWDRHANFEFVPRGVEFCGGVYGQGYVDALRSARIVIAPVWSDIRFNGKQIQGDMVTARTFQLAAAYTFFLHKRTEEALATYDEQSEVPMWDDADELIPLLVHFINNDERRRSLATNAHARAVPAYSLHEAADMICNRIRSARCTAATH